MNRGFDKALNASVATLLLAGCGASQSPIAMPNSQQSVTQARKKENTAESLGSTYKTSRPLLYVASYDAGLTPLRIYKANARDPEPIAEISENIANASGVCIDGDGTLYVTNQTNGSGWVSEYPIGETIPSKIITQGIDDPAYCAIDASGNLWVTNIGLHDVAEYLKGSTKPNATITKGLTYPDGIAIDHAGNLYVGNLQPSSTSNVQVYAPGSKSPSRTITGGITWPVGLAVDSRNTLYVANFYASGGETPGNIEEYRLGESTPYRTISDGLVNPSDVTVNKTGRLFVANWPDSASDPYVILEYPPSALKPSSRQITKGVYDPQGLAYYPPVLP